MVLFLLGLLVGVIVTGVLAMLWVLYNVRPWA